MTHNRALMAFIFTCFGINPAQSEIDSGTHSSHGTHTHGLAHMTLVFEAGKLLLELETPAANVLGFEHQPRDTKQWQAVKALRSKLRRPASLVTLKPDCELQNVQVSDPFGNKAQGANIQHNNIDHEQTHNNLWVRYQWQCNTTSLPEIRVNVFETYSVFEKVQVQWISGHRQGATTLNKYQSILEVSP